MTPLLSRYEAARVIGLRALQLSEGMQPNVRVEDARLRKHVRYIAALELYEGKLDAQVLRGDTPIDVRTMRVPPCVYVLLDTEDGGHRVG